MIAAHAKDGYTVGPWGALNAPGAALSPSQVTTYLNCSAAWFYKYKLNLPTVTTAGQALGKGVHRAVAGFLALKARGHVVDQPQAIRLHAQMATREELAQAELRTDEDAEQLIVKAGEMAAALLPEAQALQPSPVEESYGIEWPVEGEIAGVPVRGIVDVLTDEEIIDWKTSSRSPSGVSNGHRIQLASYAELTGRTRAKLITVTSAATPKVTRQSVIVDAGDREHVRQLFPIVADAIKSGVTVPNRTSAFCSRKNCSHWRVCQRDYGGTVAD